MNAFQSRSIFKNAYRSDIVRTIIICGGFFVGLWFIEIIFKLSDTGTAFFFKYLKNPLLLPLNAKQFIYQPWSIFTYGFIENNFWSLLTNMVWLWIFGTVIEDLRGINRVFPIFWAGSIFAGFALLLFSYFYTPTSPILYMSTLGGVAAVAAATVTFKPKYVFYALFNRGIPIYVFGIIFLALSIFLRMNNYYVVVVFVSGALVGYLSQNILYVFFEKTRTLLGNLRAYFSSNKNFIKKPAGKVVRMQPKNNDELELNKILDKINTHGMESLSKKELAYLERFEN